MLCTHTHTHYNSILEVKFFLSILIEFFQFFRALDFFYKRGKIEHYKIWQSNFEIIVY